MIRILAPLSFNLPLLSWTPGETEPSSLGDPLPGTPDLPLQPERRRWHRS